MENLCSCNCKNFEKGAQMEGCCLQDTAMDHYFAVAHLHQVHQYWSCWGAEQSPMQMNGDIYEFRHDADDGPDEAVVM